MERKYTPIITLARETTLHLGDHEVLLSFNNDSDAEPFEQWFENEGRQAYEVFLEKWKHENY